MKTLTLYRQLVSYRHPWGTQQYVRGATARKGEDL